MQRGRDSNPRCPFGAYTLSRRAPSTTRPPLYNFIAGAKIVLINGFIKIYEDNSPHKEVSKSVLNS